MDETREIESKKPHRERRAGRKANKKKEKKILDSSAVAQKRNPKAFTFHSIVKAQRQHARTQDLTTKKHHIPVIDRTPVEPPPIIVAIVGGEKVGKSTLMSCLIKNYTRRKLSSIEGPVTVVAGKRKRLTFIEVTNDINVMIDVAKIADIVLMLIDVTFGIEMEIFEFLEICRAYGAPRIMGILNHLDMMKDSKALKKKKKDLKRRFQVELYPGAKLFYLSGILHGEYLKNEVSNLGRFISVMKFRPLQFRSTHPYILVDRMEDITNAETIRQNPKSDRRVVLYGFVRGIPLRPKQAVHIPGVGDFRINEINALDDPCPLPETLKKRSLNSKERLLYAPMSGVSGVVYDKDAIYIDLGGSHHMKNDRMDSEEENKQAILDPLLQLKTTTDEKRAESTFRLFSNSQPISDQGDNDLRLQDVGSNRTVRQVTFAADDDDDDKENLDSDSNSDDSCQSSKRRKIDAIQSKENSTINIFNSFEPGTPGLDKSESFSATDYVTYYNSAIYGADVDVSSSDDESEGEEATVGGLLKKVNNEGRPKGSGKMRRTDLLNEVDTARCSSTPPTQDWDHPKTLELIKDCFVTGEWNEKESAEKLLQMDDEDDDIYGDFEDLETGVKFEAPEGSEEEKEVVEEKKEKSAQEKRLEKKRRLKEFFDSEYDDKGDHYETLKAELSQQAELNRTQFEGMDEESRIKYEGYRAGLYVRVELENMYCELVTNFDSKYPIIIGGLLDNEQSNGYVKVRMKVHRWYPRILKNRDPLTLSLGWRRFQTLMYYAKREDNFRYRSLKYARKYLHVEALFWGPTVETSSGFIAIQNINERTPHFRIAANGVVLENDQSTKLVKKMKLLGYPSKILKNTAFIKDMFHSEMEVAKFIGAKLQTQSSLRGIIKKSQGQDGLFRATFEDQIKMSDVVMCKTWAVIEVAKFCSVVKNLLLADKNSWRGLKRNAEVKRERNMKNLVNPDCLYTEIEKRREYIYLPLKIPKALQNALPYKDKPKVTPKLKKQQRVVVVKDPEEVRMEDFMKKLKVMMREKRIKDKAELKLKKKNYRKEVHKREALRMMRERKTKANACKMISLKTGKIKL